MARRPLPLRSCPARLAVLAPVRNRKAGHMPSPQPLLTSPDISQITEYLFISVWPEARHADEIVQLGIGLVLSMHWMPPQRSLRRLPLTVLWLPTIDTPLTPMPMGTLRRGVETALPRHPARGQGALSLQGRRPPQCRDGLLRVDRHGVFGGRCHGHRQTGSRPRRPGRRTYPTPDREVRSPVAELVIDRPPRQAADSHKDGPDDTDPNSTR